YIALDLDPARIRAARQAGDPVLFGDSADEELLGKVGLRTASAIVISFSDPATSIGILHSVRRLRPEVPVLVRTQDDARIKELQDAGATDVVPETFEASLMLVSHVLMLLRVPVPRVVRTLGEIRRGRYAVLRNIVPRGDARPVDETSEHREELKSVVVPPGAWAVGRTLGEVRSRGVEVTFTGVRRLGILGRDPAGDMVLRDGDIVVSYGQPEGLARGALMGEILREQGGQQLFELVELDRVAAIRGRAGPREAHAELAARVRERPPALAREVVRAFSTWFQSVNLAERVHRIRRRREYLLKDSERPQPGGVEDAIAALKSQGLTAAQVLELIGGLSIEPVFAPHSTEASRRTLLGKQLRIAQRLVERLDPTL